MCGGPPSYAEQLTQGLAQNRQLFVSQVPIHYYAAAVTGQVTVTVLS